MKKIELALNNKNNNIKDDVNAQYDCVKTIIICEMGNKVLSINELQSLSFFEIDGKNLTLNDYPEKKFIIIHDCETLNQVKIAYSLIFSVRVVF